MDRAVLGVGARATDGLVALRRVDRRVVLSGEHVGAEVSQSGLRRVADVPLAVEAAADRAGGQRGVRVATGWCRTAPVRNRSSRVRSVL